MLSPTPHERVADPIGVAVVGAGFVARGLLHRLRRRSTIGGILVVNRTPERGVEALKGAGVEEDDILLSNDPTELSEALANRRCAVAREVSALPEVGGIDVVVEVTGAMEYGAKVILAALGAGRHVVSMNAEVDALLGHHLDSVASASGAVYTIADGDQPGVLLRMMEEAVELGLEPTVALNCKRNLNPHQSLDDSRPFAERDGTSAHMTTAFGDGTKMHIENVVTANLSGLTPAPMGTPGVRTELASVADDVRSAGIRAGSVHFTLGGDFGGGVLVLASSPDPDFDAPYLRYGKLGDGPWYPLFRPYHLIHMEVPTTIEQVAGGGPALGRRTPTPVARCVAIAKRDLPAGAALDGIGGDACYGLAATSAESDGGLEIGLSHHARIRRRVDMDRPITIDDVELDEDAFLVETHRQATAAPRS